MQSRYLSGDINAAEGTLMDDHCYRDIRPFTHMTLSSPPLSQQPLRAGTLRRMGAAGDGSLFTPLIDFLCLGGGSLMLFIPLSFLDVETFEPMVAATILFLAHFINSPHFAHSYQIFYRNFAEKAFGQAYRPQLRVRYIIAGIIAPLALITFFVIAAASDSARVLGFGFNVMLFLVGWHYVKQGYGMMIVDSVLKKNFFSARDKTILIVNSYLCWLSSWALLNNAVSQRDLFGLIAYSIPVPEIALTAVGLTTAASSALSLMVILRRWRSGKPFPVNGAVAYFVTLYVWVLFPAIVAPAVFVVLMILATPAAHSLQYLIVVWRYQLNVERDKLGADRPSSLFTSPVLRLAYFFIFGLLISFCGFWIIPTAFDLFASYDRSIFGGQMFLFMFAIFINVHHYFLDNVMWRRENPDVAKHLFRAS